MSGLSAQASDNHDENPMIQTEEQLLPPRVFPPCVSVSTQANEFMSQSSGASWANADLSAAGLGILRRDNKEFGAQAWEIAQRDCAVTLKDEIIGGVQCQWVSPAGCTASEVVLFFYGGAFVVGGPEDDLSMTARIASCLGRRVCVPRYRLAPEHPFPAARDDSMAVYRALVDSDCKNILIVGESAGGNLALGLVLGILTTTLPAPLAVALLSPWIDLTHSGDSHATLFGLDPTLSVRHFLKPASLAYAGQRRVSDPEISPLFAEIPSHFPPTLISTATRDLLLSDCVRLARKLRCQKGNCVELVVAEGLWHVYEWYPQCPEAVESLQYIASFLERHCKEK